MKWKLIAIMVFMVFLHLSMYAPANGDAITYTISIYDATEDIGAIRSPEVGVLNIQEEGIHDVGRVEWTFPHDIATDQTYTYNIFEPENPEILSDTLMVKLTDLENTVYVKFESDSLSEGDISPYSFPTGYLPEEWSGNFDLGGGDTLHVYFVSPEPGTLLLLVIATLCVVRYRLRRK